MRDRILLACGLLPLPTKTPLNAVVHGRIERDDYTVDRVFFESFPGHYVCGNLYLPKKAKLMISLRRRDRRRGCSTSGPDWPS